MIHTHTHQLQKAESRCRFVAHLQLYPVKGFDTRTSPGHPAAGPPTSGLWFVPETPALRTQSAGREVSAGVRGMRQANCTWCWFHLSSPWYDRCVTAGVWSFVVLKKNTVLKRSLRWPHTSTCTNAHTNVEMWSPGCQVTAPWSRSVACNINPLSFPVCSPHLFVSI